MASFFLVDVGVFMVGGNIDGGLGFYFICLDLFLNGIVVMQIDFDFVVVFGDGEFFVMEVLFLDYNCWYVVIINGWFFILDEVGYIWE